MWKLLVLRTNTDDGLDTFMLASFGFAYGRCGSNSTLWRGALRLRSGRAVVSWRTLPAAQFNEILKERSETGPSQSVSVRKNFAECFQ